MLIFLGVAIACTMAQSTAKFNLKAGYSSFRFADEKDLMETRAHPSQHVGFDILIEKNGGLFMPGFHYYRMGLEPEDFTLSNLFSDRPYVHLSRIPLSFGYRFDVVPLLDLSLYAGASVSFFVSVDDNDLGLIADRFRGVHPGWHFGAQVLALNHITIDMKYEHAMTELIKTREESKIRGFSMTVGFIF